MFTSFFDDEDEYLLSPQVLNESKIDDLLQKKGRLALSIWPSEQLDEKAQKV